MSGAPSLSFPLRGFTLLEMLLVMTLAALILTVVPPSFTAMLPHLEQRSEAKALATVLRSVRGRAIRERGEFALMLDLERREYRQPGSEKVTRLSEAMALSYRPAFDSMGKTTSVAIRFFADGSSSGGTIAMVATEARYEIHIDWLSGRVRYREKV